MVSISKERSVLVWSAPSGARLAVASALVETRLR